ncbi:MAG: hypothetical protein HDT14_13285 [Oscillibacter sp.]|nr:hypothetical protein [Oscillibacter sp.]
MEISRLVLIGIGIIVCIVWAEARAEKKKDEQAKELQEQKRLQEKQKREEERKLREQELATPKPAAQVTPEPAVQDASKTAVEEERKLQKQMEKEAAERRRIILEENYRRREEEARRKEEEIQRKREEIQRKREEEYAAYDRMISSIHTHSVVVSDTKAPKMSVSCVNKLTFTTITKRTDMAKLGKILGV